MRGNIITSTGPAPLFTPGSDLQWALSKFDKNLYWVDGQGTKNAYLLRQFILMNMINE